MRPIFILLLALAVTSCSNSGKKSDAYLRQSIGNINSVQIVIENELWAENEVGEAIREHLASPVDGLPQIEPLFSLTQMPPDTYDSFARTYRSFMYVELGEKDSISFRKNIYAKPQTGIFIKATTEQGLVNLINENSEKIVATLKQAELKEKQRRIRISLMDVDSLKNDFGVSLNIPAAYRVAQQSEDLYWIRKDLKDGNTNIIIYEAPIDAIEADSTAVSDIIKVRDSIGGELLILEEDGGRFVTEEAYSPFLFKTEVAGLPTYETKGTWEVKGRFIAGPFVNYAIKDEANNRYLILEGFVHAPRVDKRDHQFEMEAILRSAKLEAL